MARKAEYVVLGLLEVLLALTAIAGGIGLVGGGVKPPPELLASSSFGSYLVPGLVLLIAVGGTASIAAVAQWLGTERASYFAILAGAMTLLFEAVEMVVIGLHLDPPLQLLDLAVGLTLVGLGVHASGQDRWPLDA